MALNIPPLTKQLLTNARSSGIPIFGTFELTPRCTLDCKMCYSHLTMEQMGNRIELGADFWKRIADEAFEAGLFNAILTGGECLLHPDFSDIYSYMRNKGIIVAVNSNGTILSDSVLELFQKLPPRAVNLSIYGSNDESYLKVTGHKSFERVIRNIMRLKEANIPVKISITPSKYLQEDVIHIISLCKEMHLPYTVNNSLFSAHEGTERRFSDYCMTTEEEIALRLAIKETENRAPDSPYNFIIPKRCADDSECTGLHCNAGMRSFSVSWEGILYPCLGIRDVSCSLTEHSFAEAWEYIHSNAKKIVVPAECEECEARAYCQSCYQNRADPNDPRHCNPKVCEQMRRFYEAGVAITKQK